MVVAVAAVVDFGSDDLNADVANDGQNVAVVAAAAVIVAGDDRGVVAQHGGVAAAHSLEGAAVVVDGTCDGARENGGEQDDCDHGADFHVEPDQTVSFQTSSWNWEDTGQHHGRVQIVRGD